MKIMISNKPIPPVILCSDLVFDQVLVTKTENFTMLVFDKELRFGAFFSGDNKCVVFSLHTENKPVAVFDGAWESRG